MHVRIARREVVLPRDDERCRCEVDFVEDDNERLAQVLRHVLVQSRWEVECLQ